MPYQQSYIDPNTGATFPASYIRILSTPRVNFSDPSVGFAAARWVSSTQYSLGFHPIQSVDINVQGAAYASFFAPNVNAAQASFNSMLLTSADSYIGGLPTLSGAQAVS